eukprot:6449839-Prymnesium_polylepis.1
MPAERVWRAACWRARQLVRARRLVRRRRARCSQAAGCSHPPSCSRPPRATAESWRASRRSDARNRR